jgi:hypothetical protein
MQYRSYEEYEPSLMMHRMLCPIAQDKRLRGNDSLIRWCPIGNPSVSFLYGHKPLLMMHGMTINGSIVHLY